mgnify:CR=1 FL=1
MNAVIFDLDGTLWDSSDEVVIAWNEVLSRATDGKLQIDKEFMQSIMGKNMEEIKGILREERVDEAYLQRWEASVAASTAEQHGDGEAGCDTEKAARGETGNTVEERIADFRQKIAARKEATGKDYLSFYFVEALAYEVVE